MKALLVLTVLLLSACAQTPAQVLSTGYRTEQSSALDARASAHCVVTNLENMSGRLQARMRQLQPSGDYDIVVYGPADTGVFVVVRTNDTPQGSQVVIWQSSSAIFGAQFMADLLAGC